MSEEIDNVTPAEAGAEKPVRKRARRVTAEPAAAADHANAGDTGLPAVSDDADSKPKRGRSRAKKSEDAATDTESGAATAGDAASPENAADTSGQAGAESADESASAERPGRNRNRSRNRSGGNGNGAGNDNGNNAEGESEASERSGRNRQRDRRRGRGGSDDIEPEILEDDVLLPIGGILDILDNYAFVRTSGYLPGAHDVYVSLGQVKKYNLRRGDAIIGSIKQPREGESNSRQKFNALVRIDSINGQSIDESGSRSEFADLTPLYPQERLRLETEAGNVTTRVIDLLAPVGKGERGLIVAPPAAGKSTVLREIAHAVSANNPEAHLMVVLVDERPEEVTDMERSVRGEVIASTFDRPAEDHTMIAELAVERAKRLVELGQDVVLLLDSLTALARAYNLSTPAVSRSGATGLDAQALYPAKKFFGSARKIENGGSLTIIATASAEGGSQIDSLVLEEFAATANMELRLSRDLAAKRLFPAVDVSATRTRHDEAFVGDDERAVVEQARRSLARVDQAEALEALLDAVGKTSSNVEFLTQVKTGKVLATLAGVEA